MYIKSNLLPGQKIYFASDFHLGAYPYADSVEREKRILDWLDHIRLDAQELYLVGDVFDFWFEYGTVIPKGYTRFLGKLAELSDAGVQITFFKGNHDMWMFGYLQEELGARVISDECVLECSGKRFFLHHGDGLGPSDQQYKLLKKIFRSNLCQWLFARLHPNLGIGIARRWSKQSRVSSGQLQTYLGPEKEWLVCYSQEVLKKEHFDYLVFGHRHLPIDLELNSPNGIDQTARYINLGEWINYDTYAVFDGAELSLTSWKQGCTQIIRNKI